jgi:hypothetical protein
MLNLLKRTMTYPGPLEQQSAYPATTPFRSSLGEKNDRVSNASSGFVTVLTVGVFDGW